MIAKRKVKFCLKLSTAIAIVGILFKVMHWPFSATLVIIGSIGITIFYSLKFYQKKTKKLLDYSSLFLLISFLTHYLLQIFHLPYGFVFTTITQFALIVFLIVYFQNVFFNQAATTPIDASITKTNTRYKTLRYALYGIAVIGITVGAQFKILHWEFGFINGSILLTIGLLAAAVSLFVMGDAEETE